MFENKSLELRDRNKSEAVETDPSDLGYFSSALVALSRSLHARFCTSLEMRNLAKERDRNELKASLLSSKAKVARAQNELKNISYETQAETIKAKSTVQLADLESQKKICQAEKGLAQTKNDLDLVIDPESHLLRKRETSLRFEEKIATLRASIRTHTREENTGTETASSKPKPSPEEYRDRKMTRLKVIVEDDAVLDEWRKDRLAELDDLKHNELAEVDASPWSDDQKAKKRYEIEARFSNRREQILTAKP